MRKWLVSIILLGFNYLFICGINFSNKIMFENGFMVYLNKENKPVEQEEEENSEVTENTEYNGESIEEIGKKFDKVFEKTDLEGLGEYIASASIKKSVNPYLVGGIILESTNCKIDCTVLLKKCNNTSGVKGEPGCFGGSYKEFDSVTSSINELVNSISKDFYTAEMQTPLKMFKSYGKTEVWAFKVNKYMEQLKRGK